MTDKKKYFIGGEKPKPLPYMHIRTQMLPKYRPVISAYRTLPLHKQFFKLMVVCRENDVFITKGETVAILREFLSTKQPNKHELDHLNTAIFQFRKWLGSLAGMVVYGDKILINGKINIIFKPIKTKREYMKIAGQHIERVTTGLELRHTENLQILKLTDRQIRNKIDELSNEIDAEAELPNPTPTKRKRRK